MVRDPSSSVRRTWPNRDEVVHPAEQHWRRAPKLDPEVEVEVLVERSSSTSIVASSPILR